MKTKILFKSFIAAILIMAFISCKKSETQQSVPATLTGTWSASNWGGISGNVCTFSVAANATVGVITQIGSQPFNFSVGDNLYSNITNVSTGNYTATGKYTYGSGNSQVGSASATLTLQNSNTQLRVQYSQDPATGITPPTYVFVRQ